VSVAISDALLDRGAVHVVDEMLTHKSDDVPGRMALYEDIVKGEVPRPPSMPQATRTLERLLWAMGFEVDFDADEVELKLMTDSTVASLAPGRVTKPETLNSRTLLPERGGLFCTEVFGALGSPERFTSLGHVDLAVPLLHPWARGVAASVLGMTRRTSSGCSSVRRPSAATSPRSPATLAASPFRLRSLPSISIAHTQAPKVWPPR